VSKKGEGRLTQRDGQPSGRGSSPPPKSLAPRAGHTTAGPVSGISRRVCTRHTTSDANPSLPARFPSWWHAINPTPVRNLVPRVHAGRDIRHEGRLRPRQGQKFRPTCTHGTRFPTWTRQGGAFPLLAGSIGLSPVGNSIPCVHARRDFRHVHRWTTGSESVCPRSRTPSALAWPPAGKRGLGPQPSATGPNTARRNYPHSSSARLPRALLSTRAPAGTELQR
jgi:hypothetical protein